MNLTLLLPARQEKRDYGQDNYDRIKQIQRANKDKQRDKSKQEPVKAVHSPGKYDHIQSKVAERLQVSGFINIDILTQLIK